MAPSREDFQLLLQIEQAMKPQKAAKQFVWSDGVKGVNAGPGFFEAYGWDSDERMHVNEVASYYETFAMAWQRGFVDEELVLDWVPATLYWGLIGPILLAARDMLGDPELWSDAVQTAVNTGSEPLIFARRAAHRYDLRSRGRGSPAT